MLDTGDPGTAQGGQPAASERDALLISELQDHFPIAVEPYRLLAERLETTEEQVLRSVSRLKESRILRHISPIFDAAALGYSSSLVAMSLPPGDLDNAAAAVSAHPGVSHNYRRDHAYNLWFTIAVPPGARLEEHVQRLHALSGARSTRLLPTVRSFKIGVSLDASGRRPLDHRQPGRPAGGKRIPAAPLTAGDIALIRAVQGDLPLETRPFRLAAEALGTSEARVVEDLQQLVACGRLRRIAGILRHRTVGYSANGMAVWNVPDERIEEVGRAMAAYSAISHCYQRPRFDDWPYNLFTMIHARSQRACDAFVGQLAEACQVPDVAVLYSTVEYKKVRPTYFTTAHEAWERAHGIR